MKLSELPNFAPAYERLSADLRQNGAEAMCARDHVLLSLGMAAGAHFRDEIMDEVSAYRLVDTFATVLKQLNDEAKDSVRLN